ncbi:MAG: AAA family ATPase [Planctomycetaceae bacterium]|nr:AAA family ATPase [Planctomycetaceae bacterium]
MSSQAFVKKVKIRNFKSIAECDVELGRLTLLVGRNGAGKSNFLDALRFVTDSLETSVDHALKSRGGLSAVRRISTGHPRNFSIGLELLLESSAVTYKFEIGAQPRGGFIVKSESLEVRSFAGNTESFFSLEGGAVTSTSAQTLPPVSSDRLFLVLAAGLPEFRPAYDALQAMGFYNLNPEEMKEIQKPDAGQLLMRDGSNLASVLARLQEDSPAQTDRIKEYLRVIVPEIADFHRISVGHQETLEFRQHVTGSTHPWRFHAISMSDGTMRALGILTAVMQLAGRSQPVRLVGIEEPETALHPAAAGALMDALREASDHTQIIATTHSPDLLDRIDPSTDQLLAISAEAGNTWVGSVDEACRDSIQQHLFTAGELLRMDQLHPARSVQRQPALFD